MRSQRACSDGERGYRLRHPFLIEKKMEKREKWKKRRKIRESGNKEEYKLIAMPASSCVFSVVYLLSTSHRMRVEMMRDEG